MSRLIRSATVLLLVIVAGVLASPPAAAQQSLADQFADRQVFYGNPPTMSDDMSFLTGYVIPNGRYESLGPPFSTPRPPLPPDVTYVMTSSSQYTMVSGTNPRCVSHYYHWRVELTFTDGSTYSYSRDSLLRTCSNGTWIDSDHSYQRADAGPPGYGNVDKVQREDRRSAYDDEEYAAKRCAADTGRTIAYAGVVSRPLQNGGTLELLVGPGGSLDLRQNAAAGGPLFVTETPALLRCDTILLDPGVTLADLFLPPPIVLPAALQPALDLSTPGGLAVDDPAPRTIEVRLHNSGNTAGLAQVAWSDARGWIAPGQTQVLVPMGTGPQITLNLQIPAGTPAGTVDELQIQLTPQSPLQPGSTHVVNVTHDPVGVFRFGSGTPGCSGPHAVDATAALVAGGPALVLECTGAQASAPALWMVGFDVAPEYGTWQFPGLPAFHVDPFGALFMTFFTFADPAGTARTALQAPADPYLKGLEVVCQALAAWTGPCVLPGSVSSSPALGLVVQ